MLRQSDVGDHLHPKSSTATNQNARTPGKAISVSSESGIDFLLRMMPPTPINLTGIGEVKPKDFLHLKTSSSSAQRASLTHAISEVLVYLDHHQLDANVFVIDLVSH